jgi:hypothetical protein
VVRNNNTRQQVAQLTSFLISAHFSSPVLKNSATQVDVIEMIVVGKILTCNDTV